jgi:NADH:ubiquinone reductase (H+-translocating)
VEDDVIGSTVRNNGQIVVAGAGYAGLHVALRLTARLRNNPTAELILVDWHDYHQVLTELPRVAAGTRAADAVRIPLQDLLAERVRFVQTEITGFDLADRQLHTGAGPIGWRWLVLALGSRPNDFAIPGLAERTLSLYSAGDAERVWAAVSTTLTAAAAATDPEQQRRLATVVVGGGGATGVELAGELAEILPEAASRHGLAPDRPAVVLIEAGPTILAGSSPQLIDKATRILYDLGVQVRTNAAITTATEEGFRLSDGRLVEGGLFLWAGGARIPVIVATPKVSGSCDGWWSAGSGAADSQAGVVRAADRAGCVERGGVSDRRRESADREAVATRAHNHQQQRSAAALFAGDQHEEAGDRGEVLVRGRAGDDR